MAKQTINIGTVAGDGTGDSIRNAFSKANDNFTELYTDVAAKLSPNGDGSSLTGLTKTQVGLANVDNTSDANKPISTATQAALDLKADLSALNTTNTNVTALTSDKLDVDGNGSELTGLTKSQVGLANVDNTSDANKPISTATQTALDLKADLSALTTTNTNVTNLDAAKQDKMGVTVDSTTARTLALGDAGDLIRFTNASAVAVTIPANASVAFPIATRININQGGAGVVTITGDSGVSVEMLSGKTGAMVQYGVATLIKVATDTWILKGDLA